MSARQQVNELLGQWLELTQAEAGAIQSAAWSSVGEIQSAKQALQNLLTGAMQRWAFENGRPVAPGHHPFSAEVSHLLSLESRNARLLDAQFHRARLEQEEGSDGLRNLRRLRRSYVQKSTDGWELYS